MEKRIYYHDTDAGGVVYYGRYLSFLEEARTELLDQTGLTVKDLNDRGYLFAVRKCMITYKAPARYGDIILCDAKIIRMTAAVGHPTLRLVRWRIGDWSLDGIEPGTWRDAK